MSNSDEFNYVSDAGIIKMCHQANAAINGEGLPPELGDLVIVIEQLRERLQDAVAVIEHLAKTPSYSDVRKTASSFLKHVKEFEK